MALGFFDALFPNGRPDYGVGRRRPATRRRPPERQGLHGHAGRLRGSGRGRLPSSSTTSTTCSAIPRCRCGPPRRGTSTRPRSTPMADPDRGSADPGRPVFQVRDQLHAGRRRARGPARSRRCCTTARRSAAGSSADDGASTITPDVNDRHEQPQRGAQPGRRRCRSRTPSTRATPPSRPIAHALERPDGLPVRRGHTTFRGHIDPAFNGAPVKVTLHARVERRDDRAQRLDRRGRRLRRHRHGAARQGREMARAGFLRGRFDARRVVLGRRPIERPVPSALISRLWHSPC